MTGRERFRAVVRFEPVDRPPYWELFGPEPGTLQRWEEEGLPPDEYFEAYFDLDRIETVPVRDGLVPPFPEEIEDLKAGVVVMRDASGRLVRRRGGSTVEVVSYPLVTRADLASLRRRLNPRSPRRFPRHWVDYLRSVRERDYPLGVDVTGPLGRLVELAGPEWSSALLEEDPDFLCEALDVFTGFLVDLLRPVLAAVGEVDFLLLRESLPVEGVTTRTFEEFLAPRYRLLARVAVDYGVESLLLICPGWGPELAGRIREAGFTAFGPISTASGPDPADLRNHWGTDLVLIGGLDVHLLARDSQTIERELSRLVRGLRDEGGWIPSLDRPIPPSVPLDNYRYYWELLRDLLEG